MINIDGQINVNINLFPINLIKYQYIHINCEKKLLYKTLNN